MPQGDLVFAPIADRSARTFLIQAAIWNLVLFAVIQLPWIDRHVIGALVNFQTSVVSWYGAQRAAGLVVSSSCSGADVMALCLGVTLAYPASWTRRLSGALGGMALVLTLNAVRLATLYAARTPSALNMLHVYVWPAILTSVTTGYVFLWIRRSERRAAGPRPLWARFTLAVLTSLLVYAAAVPFAFTSATIHEIAVWTSTIAGALLTGLGASVRTIGSALITSRGSFDVTQECLFTPMIPLYLAAVCALPMGMGRRVSWAVLACPLFFVFGVTRLLMLALPAYLIAAPMPLAHGFYQLVAGLVAIVAAAHVSVRGDGWRASTRVLIALIASLGVAVAAGPSWTSGLLWTAGTVQRAIPATVTVLNPAGDVQGALALFPIYQLALLVGLWVATTGGRRPARLVAALSALVCLQIVFLIALGSVAARLGVYPHALVVRGWALAVPVALAAVWVLSDGTVVGDRSYLRFWRDVGATFPVLTGAASTSFYFENEKRLLSEALPSLAGSTVLKTDLWDEAKNTRILQWMADQGANVYAIDISEPIAREARDAFGSRGLRVAVTDVRRLPFAPDSFDAIYSMGTVEHFADTEVAVEELARVLKPDGRLILGVPNRWDPFLRPAMVAVLYRLGCYAYGYEKSYSRRALARLLERAGLDVEAETGILLLPGWLRMVDLWCYTRLPPLAAVTRALIRPFVWLDRRFTTLRRHGYLLASVGVKRQASSTTPCATQTGIEYLVEARGCDPATLRSLPRLQQLFDDVLTGLALQPVQPPSWHVFPGPAGITGIVLLAESHLTMHTYPESRLATINLYCCRRRVEWDWDRHLGERLGARQVSVRTCPRG